MNPKKQYTLKVPGELDGALRALADRHSVTIEDAIRQAVRLLLVVDKVQSDPNASLIVREGDGERELVLFTPQNDTDTTNRPAGPGRE